MNGRCMQLRPVPKRFLVAVMVGSVLSVQTAGCSTILWQARFLEPKKYGNLDTKSPFLKCHTKDGKVYVLKRWKVYPKREEIGGVGLLYDVHRKVIGRGELKVPFGKIVLLETNRPQWVMRASPAAIAVLGILTTATVIGMMACVINPKACWGSCPTFYAHDGKGLALQAEGFSWSVARALEATDVDSLYTARPAGRQFSLTMTNEALETHAVRSLRLIAVPRTGGRRVFRAGRRYFPARSLVPPVSCFSEQGDCLKQVRSVDKLEYLSPADGKDLAAREIIQLVFPRPVRGGRLGLVVGARNSLLNTFLFYQLLAYMGKRAGEWLMKLERGGSKYVETVKGIGRTLGDVDVWVRTRKGWRKVGAFAETGPIAKEMQLVLLPSDIPPGRVRVRLRLTRGNWKLDYLALARLGRAARPAVLLPKHVDRRGRADPVALKRLRDPKKYLMSYPRDVFTIHFALPGEPARYELFLESRGFYYEWIRPEWMKEENAERLVEFLLYPARAMRRLAPAYKRVENRMEGTFWRSRIGVWP